VAIIIVFSLVVLLHGSNLQRVFVRTWKVVGKSTEQLWVLSVRRIKSAIEKEEEARMFTKERKRLRLCADNGPSIFCGKTIGIEPEHRMIWSSCAGK
jgi:hypothetical protein